MWFDNHGTFSLFNGSRFGKNVIIFVADMSFSVHVNNKKKDILNLGKGPTDESDDTTLTAGKLIVTQLILQSNRRIFV